MTRFSNFTDDELDAMEAAFCNEGLGYLVDEVRLERRYCRPMWIPVSERLPEDHKDVLICLLSDQICIGFYNSHKPASESNLMQW